MASEKATRVRVIVPPIDIIPRAAAERAPDALSAVGYYLIAFLCMNLAAFAVLAQVERMLGSDDYDAVRGLGRRPPWPAAALTLALLSLAGIPPLAGFAGKVFLLIAAIDGGFVWLAVLAALNMAVALYYYAIIVAEMFFREPERMDAVVPGSGYSWTVGLCTLARSSSASFPDWCSAWRSTGRACCDDCVSGRSARLARHKFQLFGMPATFEISRAKRSAAVSRHL